MRFFTYGFCLSFLFSVATFAQPAIEVKQSEFDFKVVSEGSQVEHKFLVRNAGTEDLQISKVLAGCGCTTSKKAEQIIKPSETGVIEVSFDSTGFAGQQAKALRVFSNDPKNPQLILQLKGLVQPAIEVRPAVVRFDNLKSEQKVTVRILDAKSIPAIKKVFAKSKNFSIEKLGGDQLEQEFLLKLNGELSPGEYRERAIVKLAGGKMSSVNIPVITSIKGPVAVLPAVLSFGVINPGKKYKKELLVEITPGHKIELLKAESDFAALQLDVKKISDQQYKIGVQLDADAITTEQFRGSLRLEFDSEKQKNITVNVHGIKLL